VRGPSFKGALRQAAQEAGQNGKELLWLFGPETSNASAFGGAVSVGDARLLLFPMRSPFALERLRRDLIGRLPQAGADAKTWQGDDVQRWRWSSPRLTRPQTTVHAVLAPVRLSCCRSRTQFSLVEQVQAEIRLDISGLARLQRVECSVGWK
jgi:hypothetical protein